VGIFSPDKKWFSGLLFYRRMAPIGALLPFYVLLAAVAALARRRPDHSWLPPGAQPELELAPIKIESKA